jgi:HEAT repeat protein
MTCISLPLSVLVALSLTQSPAEGDKPAPDPFKEAADAAVFPYMMADIGFVPGLECHQLLGKAFPSFRDFPSKLAKAVRSKEPAPRSTALLYLVGSASLIRSFAWWINGDDGTDLFSVALGQHERPIKSALEGLLQTVEGKDRVSAAALLLALAHDHREAADVLVGEMKAAEKARREDACRLVGDLRIHQMRIIGALSRAIADTDPDVRRAATIAVLQIGPRASATIPALIEMLESGNAARPSDSPFFGSIPLALGLRDVPASLRLNYTLLALAQMGTEAKPAVPVIQRMLEGAQRDERMELMGCLAALGQSSKQALPTVRKCLDTKDTAERLWVAATLLCIDPDERNAAEVLLAALNGRDKQARGLAIRACGDLGPRVKALVPFLAKAAGDTDDDDIQEQGARALRRMGALAEPAIPALVEMLTNDRNFQARQIAAEALGPIGKASIPALSRVLETAPFRPGRAEAAYALGRLAKDNPQVLRLLTEALADREPFVQISAAVALGRLKKGAASAKEALTQASHGDGPVPQREEDLWVRASASWALTQLGR